MRGTSGWSFSKRGKDFRCNAAICKALRRRPLAALRCRGKDTRFAAAGAKLIAMLLAVESLIAHHSAVSKVFDECRGCRVIADLAAGQHQPCRRPEQSITY